MAEEQGGQLTGVLARRAEQQRGNTQPHAVDIRGARGTRGTRVRRPNIAAPIAADGSMQVKRNELVHDITTGESVKFDRQLGETPVPGLEDRPRVEQGQEVTIAAETVQKHVDFLTTYVANLSKLAEMPGGGGRSMLDVVMQNPARQADKLLLDKLSVVVRSEDGRAITRQVVEPAKIREFLASGGDAWSETTLAMEHFALTAELGLGMHTTINHKVYNRPSGDDLRQRQTILEEDLKTLRGLLKTGWSNSATVVGAIGYIMGGRGKTEYDFQHNFRLLQEIQSLSGPEDKAVLWALTGVNLDRIDIAVTPGGWQANYHDGFTPNVQAIEKSLTNVYGARKELYVQLGLGEPPTNRGRWTRNRDVDRTRDIRTLHEFIYNTNPNVRAEGSRYRADQEVMLIYGDIVDAVGFVPTEANRLIAIDKALRIVRTRYAQRRVAREQAGESKVREAEAVKALEEKDKAMGEPDKFREERRAVHTRTRAEAVISRDAAVERRKTLTEGPESITQRENAVMAREAELTGPEFGVAQTGDMDAAVTARIGVLEGQVNAAHGAVLGQQAARVAAINAAVNAARVSWEAGMAHLAGVRTVGNVPDLNQAITAVTTPIDRQYDAITAPLQDAYDRQKAQLQALRDKYKEYQQAINDRNEATLALSAREPGQLGRAGNAFDAFIAPVPPIAIPDEVRNLPITELVARLDAAGVGATPQERLQMALDAKAQETTNRTANVQPSQAAIIAVFGGLVPPITPDDLLRTRQSELFITLRDYYQTPAGGGMALAAAETAARRDVPLAYLGVSRQIGTLALARVTHERDHYDGIIRNADAQLRNLDNLEEPRAEVRAAIRVVKGRLTTYEEANQIADNRDRLLTLCDIGVIDTTTPETTYSQVEKAASLPRGMHEWYRLLDREYPNQTDRDTSFEALRRILPPDQLAELINTYLNLGVGASNDINIVLADLQAQVLLNRITGPRLQQGVAGIISYVRDHALAL